ncbi:hypothetical protein [Actinomadura rifamycini]|uniref:hypothetical protein n=1 Tax=Actinomadura rifamycini TaxID=31962 RepID=UPI00041D0A46|nr:hypothetical protein [Actinomadura rifamycini]
MPVKPWGVGTVAGRVRALAALALLALAVLAASAYAAVGDARAGVRTLGEREGPLAERIGGMYLALTDMDAQATRVLLAGGEADWLCAPEPAGAGCERSGARYMYDIRREDAQRAALAAARTGRTDRARMRTVQALLNGLHDYDQHVQAAMDAAADPGAPPPEAVREYRTATALMTRELLPRASNLAAEEAAGVTTAYREERASVLAGRLRVLGAGLALVAAIAGLQVYLARRFRRLVSLPLAAALVGALALTATVAARLTGEAERLRTAKQTGLDPALGLTRVRALGTSMYTDRARQILDPEHADRYDRRYLDKSQAILYVAGASDLDGYYRALGRSVDFGGYFGGRERREASRPEASGTAALLAAYRTYQDLDRTVRGLAEDGRLDAAARAHRDPRWRKLPHPAFRAYDREIDARIGRHQARRVRAALEAERALRPMTRLPPVAALAVGALIAAGIRPRLAEYR